MHSDEIVELMHIVSFATICMLRSTIYLSHGFVSGVCLLQPQPQEKKNGTQSLAYTPSSLYIIVSRTCHPVALIANTHDFTRLMHARMDASVRVCVFVFVFHYQVELPTLSPRQEATIGPKWMTACLCLNVWVYTNYTVGYLSLTPHELHASHIALCWMRMRTVWITRALIILYTHTTWRWSSHVHTQKRHTVLSKLVYKYDYGGGGGVLCVCVFECYVDLQCSVFSTLLCLKVHSHHITR